MFERILIPLDGSKLAECVLPHAVAVAQTCNSEVFLLRVQDPVGTETRPRLVDPFEWQIRKAEADTYLAGVASRLQEAGLRVQSSLMEGKAAETVIKFAQDQNIDLIILSSHGQSGLSPWNVSSVVQQIILRAYRSVMIVRAYQPVVEEFEQLYYRRILVPLDGSARAEVVLPVAEMLVRRHEGQILAVHVVRKPEIPRRIPLTQEDVQLINEITERNREEASKYLFDLKSRLSVEVETRLVISEKVSSSLHSLVEQEKVDLVLLSAHGYSGDTKWPYGGNVISFIAYGSTPLLVIQDLPQDRIEPTKAEIAAKEYGGR